MSDVPYTEFHKRHAGSHSELPPLGASAFEVARAIFGTGSLEEDAKLYRAILAYLKAQDERKETYQLRSFMARDGEHYWRLVAENGKIVGTGGEGYDSEFNVYRAMSSVSQARLVVIKPGKGGK